MKQFFFIFLGLFIITSLAAQTLNRHGQESSYVSDFVNTNGARGKAGINKNGKDINLFTPNRGLAFDGVNDYVQMPADVYFNGDFTIECWVYPRSFNDWSRIIDFGNGAGMDNVILTLSYFKTGKVSFYIGSKQFESSQTLALNQWSHVAATLNGTNATIYINGVVSSTNTLPVPANVTRTKCYIGKSNWAADAYANAVYDEFRIWNTAKSSAEINAAMKSSLSGNEPGLLAYYDFNTGIAEGNNKDSTNLYDRTSGSKNGTLLNFTLNGTTSNWVKGVPLSDGTSAASAGESAYAIKRDFPSSTDGYYWIKNPNINGGAPFQIYADMTTDGGGWTLIMCNVNPNSGWTNANAVLRNQNNPTNNGYYSIIAWADYIKKSNSGFQYMMDAKSRRSYGGIWTVNQPYSFVSRTNANTDITINTKFGVWDYFEGGGFGKRMPWWTNQSNEGIITTSQSGTSYWWGTLVTGSGWSPSPWLSGDKGTLSMQGPGIIWYWVR